MIKKLLKLFGYTVINAARTGGNWIGINILSSFRNSAKENVNNNTALTVSGVYAAVRNISEDVAKIPLKIYRKTGSSKYEEPGHGVYKLLQYKPNPEMTAIALRETLTAHAMGWGNGYAYIHRDVFGNPIEIWPLRPDRVKIQRDDSDRLYYDVLDGSGHYQAFWPANILHIHGLGGDGIRGYNIIQLMSECVASGIAMDKFSASFFGNGLNSQGHLKHPTNLSQEAQERLKNQLANDYNSAGNAHQTLILEEGMDFVKHTIDPKASQMIESRQFAVTEFCRWLRIPPHKVAELSKATFSNIEQQNIDYVTDSLTGWCKRWEQELWVKLLLPTEQKQGYYFEHLLEGLLRGDIKTRYEAYAVGWDRGILSINEIRAKENLNPIDGGDQHFIPLNYAPLGQSATMNNIVTDAAKRIYNHKLQQLKQAKDKHGESFNEDKFLTDFQPKHSKYTQQVLSPFGIDADIAIDSTVDEITKVIRGAICRN